MVYGYLDKLTFLCEMYCPEVDQIDEVILNFFPFDGSVQVVNARKAKNLLTRTQLHTLTLGMLKMGNVVDIFGKKILIKGCTPQTRDDIFKDLECTFALIKPMPASMHAKVITFIVDKGFRIVQMKNGRVTKEFVQEMYKSHANPYMPLVVNYITSDVVIGLELEAPNAVAKLRDTLGATLPSEAAAGTLRSLYGHDILHNVAHGCYTAEDAKNVYQLFKSLANIFFGYEKGVPRVSFQATCKDCTCCLIKPHAVIDGNVGRILEDICTGGKFTITSLAMFSMNYVNALEFYEIYKGVLLEYEKMAMHLAEGKCVALEIKLMDPNGGDVVKEFRELCGPRDMSICRQLYPDSLRARYGHDLIHNAVHCTDLPEDGELEVEYFFKLPLPAYEN